MLFETLNGTGGVDKCRRRRAISARPRGCGERVRVRGLGSRGCPHDRLARGLQLTGSDQRSPRGRRGCGERRHEPDGCCHYFRVKKKCKNSMVKFCFEYSLLLTMVVFFFVVVSP